MKQKVRLVIALVFTVPVMVFTVSCAKKAVDTQSVLNIEPEIPQGADSSAEDVRQAEQAEGDRLRAEAAAREAAFVKDQVHFAFDSSGLSDQARQVLKGKADYLRMNPDITVTVEGHCDSRGTESYNIALGKRRADSIKSYLVGLGIGTHRLDTVSYGEDRPVAMGQNESSWAKNRRAQFLIN